MKKMVSVVIAAGLALVMGACQPVARQTSTAPATTAQATAAPATDAPAAETPNVNGAALSPAEQAIVASATALLTQELAVAGSAITLISITAVDWPDASLGCPEPGMMYAAVITPGYELVFDVSGQEYRVHTADFPGGPQVVCP